MKTIVRSALLVATALACVALAAPADAASNRTFVSGLGADTNPCTLTAPCRTLQAAYNATAPRGTIDVLDPTGYGALTITHSISIEGHGWAQLNSSANGNAITINLGPTDAVILRGLTVDGFGTGAAGVLVNGGAVILQNVTLKYLTTGLVVSNSKVDCINCDIFGNSTAISTDGAGVDTANETGLNTGLTEVRLAGGNIVSNGTGFHMNNPGIGNVGFGPVNATTIWTNFAVVPNMAGNTTFFVVTGTGSSCSNSNACIAEQTYSFNQALNLQ